MTLSLNSIDLNDYLNPSQLCTKPNQTQSTNQDSISKTQIQLEHLPTFEQPITTLKKAEITLNDCLACSGCITSAESVLVSLQSVEQVIDQINKSNSYSILSISSHSLASFVNYNNLDSFSTGFKVLRKYFTQKLKFNLILDLNFSQKLHLFESQKEFKNKSKLNKNSPLLASSCPGWICYAEKTKGQNGLLDMISRVKSAQQIQGSILKSERIANSLNVSIDQIYHVCIMSCYDKKLEASRSEFQDERGIKQVDCVITTREVQDLLERDGFDIHLAAQETQDEDLIQNNPIQFDIPIWVNHPEPKGSSSGGYLFNLLRASIPNEIDKLNRLKLSIDRKRGSDYVEFHLSLDNPHLTSLSEHHPTKNDQQAVTLFHGALFYGFKNLQNLFRKIALPSTKTNSSLRVTGRRKRDQTSLIKNDSSKNNSIDKNFDFVEVMACPSGCLNGGGQIPIPKTSSLSNKQWISKLEDVYFQKPLIQNNNQNNQHESINDLDDQGHLIIENHQQEEEINWIKKLNKFDRIEDEEQDFLINWYTKWGIDLDHHSTLRELIFYTSYKAIEVESNGFAVQW